MSNQYDPSGLDKEKASLYYSVFSSPNGRKVLTDLLRQCGFYADSWDPDPYVTSYRCGQRRFVGRILNLVAQANPEAAIEDAQDYFKGDNQ